MTTVWVVMDHTDYESDEVAGVFDTEPEAMEYAALRCEVDGTTDGFSVTSWTTGTSHVEYDGPVWQASWNGGNTSWDDTPGHNPGFWDSRRWASGKAVPAAQISVNGSPGIHRTVQVVGTDRDACRKLLEETVEAFRQREEANRQVNIANWRNAHSTAEIDGLRNVVLRRPETIDTLANHARILVGEDFYTVVCGKDPRIDPGPEPDTGGPCGDGWYPMEGDEMR